MATAEEGSEDGRSMDDVKLIASLKNKVKVLKKAYVEEHDKATKYQQQIETILPKMKSLEEALSEKEDRIAKLNNEISKLNDLQVISQAKGAVSPSKSGKSKAELEQQLEILIKENEDLKEKIEQKNDECSTNEKMFKSINEGYVQQIASLTEKSDQTSEKLEKVQKENASLKENCEKLEMQSKINFEQRSYFVRKNKRFL